VHVTKYSLKSIIAFKLPWSVTKKLFNPAIASSGRFVLT
jgi:hypothetical protein